MTRIFSAFETLAVVDRVFPWTDARAALEHVATGSHFGKVALSFG